MSTPVILTGAGLEGKTRATSGPSKSCLIVALRSAHEGKVLDRDTQGRTPFDLINGNRWSPISCLQGVERKWKSCILMTLTQFFRPFKKIRNAMSFTMQHKLHNFNNVKLYKYMNNLNLQ